MYVTVDLVFRHAEQILLIIHTDHGRSLGDRNRVCGVRPTIGLRSRAENADVDLATSSVHTASSLWRRYSAVVFHSHYWTIPAASPQLPNDNTSLRTVDGIWIVDRRTAASEYSIHRLSVPEFVGLVAAIPYFRSRVSQ